MEGAKIIMRFPAHSKEARLSFSPCAEKVVPSWGIQPISWVQLGSKTWPFSLISGSHCYKGNESMGLEYDLQGDSNGRKGLVPSFTVIVLIMNFSLVCASRTAHGFMFQLVGTSTWPPLSFTRNTTNFARLVWLAFHPTAWTLSGPSYREASN
jgi:hypothetical protein